MKFEENLTNESLTKRFANQFELVRYAITRARNAILAGREPQVRAETQNLSAKVLVEIGLGFEQLDEKENEEELENSLSGKKSILQLESEEAEEENAEEEESDEVEDIEIASKEKKIFKNSSY